jgi:hypothetical protein
MPPILAQNDLRRAAALGDRFACAADTGGLSVPPVSRLYDARPLAFSPPEGFLPSLRCHAAVLGITFSFFCLRLLCRCAPILSCLRFQFVFLVDYTFARQ